MTFTVPNIVTPCCGKPLLVLTTYTGGYTGQDVPSEIMCTAEGCYNTWEPDGTSDKYNKMPETPATEGQND